MTLQRRTNLNYEEVAQVADQIERAGGRPTLTVVQREIGGSFGTVRRFLDQWHANNKSTAVVVRELPEDVREGALSFIHGIWAQLDGEQQQKVELARREADDRIATAEAKVAEYASLLDSVEGEHEQLESALEQMKKMLEMRDGELNELRQELAAASAMASVRQSENKQLHDEITSLAAKLSAAQSEVREAKVAQSSAEKHASSIEAMARQEADASRKRIEAVEAKAEQQVAKLEARLSAVEEKAAASANQAKERSATLGKDLLDLAAERDAIKAELSVKQAKVDMFTEQLEEMRRQFAALTSALNKKGGSETQ